MHGYGGMVSFDLAVEERDAAGAAARALKSLRMIRIVPTLGGVETLAMVPAVSSHFRIPPEERRRAGIGDGLIRLSVGIEDASDIIQDLDRALERV
jgi:cystathionine beta-lyase/cystathionine gamma-synthase